MSNLERAPLLTVSEVEATARPVLEVTPAREVDLGEGTPVRRLLPKRIRSTIGAWCFVDHYGPQDINGKPGMRVPPHPHTCLQTVTWLVAGEVLHRDSLGNEQLIRPGQLNLMTAGRGIAHAEESPADHPPLMHGLQLWAALPERSSAIDPAFDHLPDLPVVELRGVRITVLIGEVEGERSDARAFSALVGAAVDSSAAADVDIPARADFEYGFVVLSGAAEIEGTRLDVGSLMYVGSGRNTITVRTSGPARLFLLGGEPFGEPLFMWWNFVAHSADEIERARADWEEGKRFGEVHGFKGPRLEAPPLPPGRLLPRG
jgi:redox-sensitive bicupin YhaK (pirin superfamily)